MAKIKNVSPLGDLDVPALGLMVKAGATIEITNDEMAASLLEQPQNWVAADKAAASITPVNPEIGE